LEAGRREKEEEEEGEEERGISGSVSRGKREDGLFSISGH